MHSVGEDVKPASQSRQVKTPFRRSNRPETTDFSNLSGSRSREIPRDRYMEESNGMRSGGEVSTARHYQQHTGELNGSLSRGDTHNRYGGNNTGELSGSRSRQAARNHYSDQLVSESPHASPAHDRYRGDDLEERGQYSSQLTSESPQRSSANSAVQRSDHYSNQYASESPHKSSAISAVQRSDHHQTIEPEIAINMLSMRDGVNRSTTTVTRAQVNQLMALGFTSGLSRALVTNCEVFHHRIWVVDNSGSMQIGDGHRVVETSDGKIYAQPVSRWEELTDAVVYHANLASILQSPTIFTLLNHPNVKGSAQRFSVAEYPGGNTEDDVRKARSIMTRSRPLGVTPLTSHIYEIHNRVGEIAPQLRRSGQRVVVVLATDGLPTDSQGYGGDEILSEFIDALHSLEGLPIWLVIRLCTDEEKVTKFYNNLDTQLELSLEVLDDFLGEAKEIHKNNKWLTYSLPMHRCRELGYHDRLFDLIDERPLTRGELRDFCALLFGDEIDDIPDTHSNWKDFVKYVQDHVKFEQEQWCPIRKKKVPLIDVKAMEKKFRKGLFKKN